MNTVHPQHMFGKSQTRLHINNYIVMMVAVTKLGVSKLGTALSVSLSLSLFSFESFPLYNIVIPTIQKL